MRCCAICVVKDAGDRIGEWIAYHLVMGFESIVLIDNGSTDQTKAVIASFQNKYDVQTWDWPMTGPTWQLRAYEHALWKLRKSYDWAMCIDDDEFLVLPNNKRVGGFAATINSEVASVAFPWAMYGSGGLLETPKSGLVIENYLRRSDENFGPNRHIKCLVRPDKVIECLSPHLFAVDGNHTLASGEMTEPAHILECSFDFSYGRVNHYFVRSRQCWDKKLARGYRDITRSQDEFELYDQNDVFDDTAANKSVEVMELINSL